ncbi:MAG: uroporphyrinogen decarboxylase family protein [Oscillospiraceae bacterium]|nr:uroporphyrinogen decarboxylase family protein [Oscillospiraceae bacterium]
MRAKDFDFDRYEAFFSEKQTLLRKIMNNEYRGPLLTQRTCGEVFSVDSVSKERSLGAQLDCLAEKMRLHCDVAFGYLEPWCGVGVYANAFGCRTFWFDTSDVQTMPCFQTVEEVANLPLPKLGDCELMRMVLEYIRYFRQETHDRIPISLTDTQSPMDTASLVLDACELFSASLEEPEALEDFLTKITGTIGDFSELQMEAIGQACYVAPGHMMLSDRAFSGISLSDDNMAVVSPASYRSIGKPYNELLSKRFGGLAIHSCGVIGHNLPQLLETEGFSQLDCKITDFEPNDAQNLAELFAGRDLLLKPCIYPDESLERLTPLLRSDIKLIVQVFTDGSIDERNRQYDRVAQFVHDHYRTV